MSDHRAYQPLMAALGAVSVGDHAQLAAALDQAEGALPGRRHDSRTAIHAARSYIEAGDGDAAWGQVYQAIVALTQAFPPDPSVCPPPPTLREQLTCRPCSRLVPADAVFCPYCGVARSGTAPTAPPQAI